MSGFAGAVAADVTRRRLLLGRLAGGAPGESVRQAELPGLGLAAVGVRDVELASDVAEGAALVVSGYLRRGAVPWSSRELLTRCLREGPEALLRAEGEWSAALWLGRELFLARDRVGSRPLYAARLGGDLVFATSIAALVRAGVPADRDRHAVACSLVLGYVPAPGTALTRVEQVGPAEVWRIRGNAVRRRLHHRFEERVDRRRSLAAAARRLDRVVTECVEHALPAAGKIGAFLSGGIDSSLVLARVHEAGREVQPFTLHFGDRLPGEIRYARAVAEHLGLPLEVLELGAREFCAALPEAIAQLEDALSEPIAVPNFVLARLAARSVDTLFTGEGGDPSFGGPKNVGLVLAQLYGGLPLAPSVAETYLAAHHHLADDLERALTPEILEGFRRSELLSRVAVDLSPRRGQTVVGRWMRANVLWKGGNNILVKVAKMVGASGLALRSPLFDPALVDLAMTIPPWQKLRGTEEKVCLKLAARRSLPRPVVERPKRGMAVPLSAWLRGELGSLARDVLTESRVRQRGFFRWSYVEKLLSREEQPTELARSRTAEKLWLLLVTELHQLSLDSLEREVRDAA